MIRLVRAELVKLRTIRLFHGVAAAMAAFGVLTVVANLTYGLAFSVVGTRFVIRRDVT
jgi:hypothetical protein